MYKYIFKADLTAVSIKNGHSFSSDLLGEQQKHQVHIGINMFGELPGRGVRD